MPLLLIAAGALVLGALGIGVATGNIAKKPFEDLGQQIQRAMGAGGGVGAGGKTRGYPSFWGGEEGVGGPVPPQVTMPPLPATADPTAAPPVFVPTPSASPQSSFVATSPTTPAGTPDWTQYVAPQNRIDTSQDASNPIPASAGTPGVDASGNPGFWSDVNGSPVFTPK